MPIMMSMTTLNIGEVGSWVTVSLSRLRHRRMPAWAWTSRINDDNAAAAAVVFGWHSGEVPALILTLLAV